eukprot:945473-Pelagomonas_calceolata.AAC.2
MTMYSYICLYLQAQEANTSGLAALVAVHKQAQEANTIDMAAVYKRELRKKYMAAGHTRECCHAHRAMREVHGSRTYPGGALCIGAAAAQPGLRSYEWPLAFAIVPARELC